MSPRSQTILLVDAPDSGDRWERDLSSAGLTCQRATFQAAVGGAVPPALIVVSPAAVERLANPMESLRQLSERGDLVVIVPANRLFLAAYLVGAGICVARAGVDSAASIVRGIFERRAARHRPPTTPAR